MQMATEASKNISNGVELTMSMLEQLAQAFGKLKSHTEASLQMQSSLQWENIKAHFLNLERSYKIKFGELEEKKKALEEKKSEALALIAEKEAFVSAKERSSLNQLQELKDDAVSALAEVRQKHKVELPELLDVKGSRDNKVRTSINDTNAPRASKENISADRSGEPSEDLAVELKPRPLLKQLCAQMDAKGLLKFLSENWKKLPSFRDELPAALKCAAEPARLVLDSLEGFFPPQGSKNTALQGLRRCYIFLMEAMPLALGMKEPGVNHHWSSEIKEQAKAIAEEWKHKLAEVDLDASNGYSLEAQALLQLLATFNVDSVLDEDELCKIVVAVSRRKQTPVLCRSLGINERIPGIIQELVSRKRQIDAVQFIQVFGLSESFPPAPLLKAYLEDLKDSLENNGDANAATAQKDQDSRELLALRTIIKCIEEYKLQKEYPLGPLQKRVAQLKPKVEKRLSGESGRFHAKKPRVSGVYAPRRPTVSADNWQHPPPMPYADRYGVGDRYHYSAPATTFEAAAYPYGEHYSAQKPYQYAGEAAASATYNPAASATYNTAASAAYNPAASYYPVYGGPGAQSAANSYAGFTNAGGQPQTAPPNAYGSYAGSGYQPPQ